MKHCNTAICEPGLLVEKREDNLQNKHNAKQNQIMKFQLDAMLAKALASASLCLCSKGTRASVARCSKQQTETSSLRPSEGLEQNCQGTIVLLVTQGLALASGTLPVLCFHTWGNPRA